MIWGIIYKNTNRKAESAVLTSMARSGHVSEDDFQHYMHRHLGFAGHALYAHECDLYGDGQGNPCVVFQGTLYNRDELLKWVGTVGESMGPAHLVSLLYRKFGESFVERMRGKFAFALYHAKDRVVILGRDRIGIEPLFFSEDEHKIVFSSSPFHILGHPEVEKALNFHAIQQFLLYCYNPSFETFFKDIHKVQPGHLRITRSGAMTNEKRFWQLSFASPSRDHEDDIRQKLLEMLREAVKIRLESDRRPGIFLSGGMDSSTIVALSSQGPDASIRTFSYRCRSESFDESRYAQIVSDHYHTHHSVVEYSSKDVTSEMELVKFMDEPFCDVGINIATDILGKAASGKVSLVLTGDGGDELFGGHPVYLADPVGRFIDRVPALIKNPLLWMGLRLRDSEKKKDFKVKWKRFSISVQFPQSLLSHRWRIYYMPDEMAGLLNREILARLQDRDPYEHMKMIHSAVDGPDYLSRSLYSDYQTVVDFYLRRMDLIRHYGIESRFPMLDERLITYGATVPSSLKIRGRSDAKYILKKTMEDILPREIVYRKDKLGHSIPLKNWMRADPMVKSFMMDLLSSDGLMKRGFIQEKVVSQFIDDHLSMKRNNSHRLWALMVLELWLREHFDETSSRIKN